LLIKEIIMETDIKLIDLRKENLNNVKEAIRLASALGAKNFKLFVNPMFVRNGLVSPRIVPMSIETPPSSQFLLGLVDLKNLKKTVDFAKKMLVDDGEATVEERPALPVTTPKVAEVKLAAEPMVTEVAMPEEVIPAEEEVPAEETQLEAPELEAEDTYVEADTEADTELETAEETEEDPKEDIQAPAPKKRKSKKSQRVYTEESE
jgi:hypothetical protein